MVRKKWVLLALQYFIIGVIICFGKVTLQQICVDRDLSVLKDDLCTVDRDLLRWCLSLQLNATAGDPMATIDDYEDLVKKTGLPETRREFKDYKTAYITVVDAHSGGNADTEGLKKQYDTALKSYRRALDDVRDSNHHLLFLLAVTSLGAAGVLFLVLTLAWMLARRETSENKAELVTTHVELDIQRKILSQILHEMRNKYTAAASMLEFVLDLCAAPKEALELKLQSLKPDLTKALALLHEADALVATRLTLHRLFAGTYTSDQQTVDLRLLLKGRIDAAAPLANSGVVFSSEVPEKYKELAVRLDLFIFHHLANNLLSNARKHTLKGTVTLRLIETEDDRLIFAVQDTGRGVPESVASRLFQEEVSTGDVRGVGLGLVSCRQFARAIGGDVWLHSTQLQTPELPGGTEFRFAVPGRVFNDQPQYETTGEATPTSPKVPSELTAIVVEDSALIRKGLVVKLQKVAEKIQTSFTFHEHPTVEAFLSSTPQENKLWQDPNVMILVDENLNAAGGILRGRDLILHLRTNNFQGIIISASGDDESVQVHRSAGQCRNQV